MNTNLLAKTNNTFALKIFKVIIKDKKNKNSFLSPISIQIALAMTFIGAREKTEEEMREVMGWEKLTYGTIHELFQEYFTRQQIANKAYTISIANRIYIEKTFEVMDEFIQEIKKSYLAEPMLANFKEEPEIERVKINTWVAERTQNKIKDLLASGILSSDSRMVLINAVYFKGMWDCPFLARDTFTQPFKVSPDRTVNVPTMTATHVLGFVKNNILGCSALEMTYQGHDFSHVIILPDEDFGLEGLIQKLDVETLDRLLTEVRHERETILLSLPKYEITSSFALKQPLSSMGMADAFSTSANFRGISCDKKGLRLSDVIHKSHLQVDEKGTEAATATAAIMIPECDIQSTPLSVDHPFLFCIVDRRYNNLLMFFGQVIDPSVKA